MSSETVPVWPRINASIRADGTGEVVVNGAVNTINAGSLDEARGAVVAIATDTARRLARPVRVHTSNPEGDWPIIVRPDGAVFDDPTRFTEPSRADNPAQFDNTAGMHDPAGMRDTAGMHDPAQSEIAGRFDETGFSASAANAAERGGANASIVPPDFDEATSDTAPVRVIDSVPSASVPNASAPGASVPNADAALDNRVDQGSQAPSLVAAEPYDLVDGAQPSGAGPAESAGEWEPAEPSAPATPSSSDSSPSGLSPWVSEPSEPEPSEPAPSEPEPSHAALEPEPSHAALDPEPSHAALDPEPSHAAPESAPTDAGPDAAPLTPSESPAPTDPYDPYPPHVSSDRHAPSAPTPPDAQPEPPQLGAPVPSTPYAPGAVSDQHLHANPPSVPAPADSAHSQFGAPTSVEHPSAAPAPANTAHSQFGAPTSLEHPSAAPAPAAGASPTPTRRELRQSFLKQERIEAPASTGWRHALSKVGIRMSADPAEIAEREDQRAVAQHWSGPRTIAVVNGKGGVGKTMTTINLAAIFARNGGAGVLAWDNNQTRGTLGWSTEQGPHDASILDLLPQVSAFLGPTAQAADLARYVHHQTSDRFDVLRSKPEVLATQQRFDDATVDSIHRVAAKFYRMIVIDSGNDETDPMWLRAVELSSQLVVPTIGDAKAAESAALLLEGLSSRGGRFAELASNAVVVVSQHKSDISKAEIQSLHEGFQPMARAVVTIPYDAALGADLLTFESQRAATRRAWLAAGAAVARGL